MDNKILSKVIVMCIQPYLDKWIGKEQSSFVLGRQIINNVVIVQELTYIMHTSTGKITTMAIKVDLEKAYDRVW